MKKQILLIALLLTTLCSWSQNWTTISSDTPKAIQVQLVHSDAESTIVDFTVSGFYTQNVNTPKGKQSIITVPDMVSMLETGAPDLPIHGVSAIIGNSDLTEVRIIASEYVDFQNIEVAPSKGNFSRQVDPETVPYTYGSSYSKNAFYPSVQTLLQTPYLIRGLRGQVLTVQPFSYNAVTKTLRVYKHLKVEIYKSGEGGENQITTDRFEQKLDPEFLQLYRNHFINYESHEQRYPTLEEEGNMLVICYGSFIPAMEPFVAWKKTIGRPIEMVDVATAGSSPAAIKAFVTDYYNTNGLTYLLLVGDHAQVPGYNNTSSGGYSDNYYGYLEGNDSYNEVFVGRFSAENITHVETQVEKIITYERDLSSDADWLDMGMGVARNEGSGAGHNGGEADYQHMDFIRDSLLNFTYTTVHQEYDGNCPGIPNTTAAMISQRINSGVTIVDYCNHGSMTGWSVGGYSISHVNALTNTDRWPFIWAVACNNGEFTSGTCFAEAWLRATYNGEPTGAIGTMMSWISQPWQPPMTGQDEMVTLLVEGYQNNIKRTFGGCSINGSMKMIDEFGSSGRSTHDTWILFGDPSMMLRTDNPTDMTVNHVPTLYIGATETTVYADAEDALVTLTLDGEILGTGYIQDGQTSISFPALTESTMLNIAVFGFNRVTYLGEIEVIPAAGPYIGYVSNTVNDAEGNNNGQIDFNESILLGMGVENAGVETATNVNITLGTDSEYITITDASHSFGSIDPGQTVNLADAFGFTVSNQVPDMTNVQFNLTISSDQNSWETSFMAMLHAPSLEVGNFFVTDPTGDNNGRLDPGETAEIHIPVANNGSCASAIAIADLTLDNAYITVQNLSLEFESIGSGETSYAVYSVSVDQMAPIGTSVDFTLSVESGAYTAERAFNTKIGLILEDYETGDFTAFDWIDGGTTPWQITGTEVFEGLFSARSGAISDNSNSILSIAYEVSHDDSLSFYRKVSSESGYDYLTFYIDNVVKNSWSGEAEWERFVYPVTAGQHTFKWEYSKDVTVAEGSDAGFIDYIIFPARLTTSGFAGNDGAVCAGESYALQGVANHYNTLLWTSSGDGSFDLPETLNPVYTPGVNDLANEGVDLTLTVTGNSSTIESTLHLAIYQQAVVTAGSDQLLCVGEEIVLGEATASHYTTVNWQTNGTGTFDDANALTTIYHPAADDYTAGSVILTLAATSAGNCGEVNDAVSVTFNALPTVSLTGDAQICSGETTQLTFELSGQSPWNVELSSGSFTIENSPYLMDVTPEHLTVYSLVQVSDANGCSQSQTGQAIVMVNFVPDTPSVPVLADTVDYAFTTTTDFIIDNVANTEAYLCQVSPENAAQITVTDNNVHLVWNTNYTGSSLVSVAALNPCGTGDWSETHEVILKNTLGLGEKTTLGFSLSPNPAQDRFRLQIPSVKQGEIHLTIVNQLGEKVYTETFSSSGHSVDKWFDSNNLHSGMYAVILENENSFAVKTLLISR